MSIFKITIFVSLLLSQGYNYFQKINSPSYDKYYEAYLPTLDIMALNFSNMW